MSNTNSDIRRKRRSSPEQKEISAFIAVPIILATGFLLSMLLGSSGTDDLPANNNNNNNQRRQLQADRYLTESGFSDKQRRFLLQNEEGFVDVGVEENVWRRQLRARKQKQRGEAVPEALSSRSLASIAELLESPDKGSGLMEDDGAGRPADSTRRMAIIPLYTEDHHFEECVGDTIDNCQVKIDNYVRGHSDKFNNQTTLMLDVRKIREITDHSYYKVVLRTNKAGTKVYGIFDDGQVFYPWPWRVGGFDTTIGPWDCDEGGTPLTPEECCAKIQEDVSDPDENGNYLACFVEEPVGGPHNPSRGNRAIVVTDGTGKVIRAPIAH